MIAAGNTLWARSGSVWLGLAKRFGRLAGLSNVVGAVRNGAAVRAMEGERH